VNPYITADNAAEYGESLPSSSSSASASWAFVVQREEPFSARAEEGQKEGQEEWLEDAATLLNGAARWLPIAEETDRSLASLSSFSSSSSSSSSSQQLFSRQHRPSRRFDDFDTTSPHRRQRGGVSDGEVWERRALCGYLSRIGLECIQSPLLDERFTLAIIIGTCGC
jgi:hypothetical protein